ncbi:MAG: RNA polymerase sigma factor RpoD/SigA [Fimbriimonas ginsengisoli]|uniref:RNA polymerase sigma factor RpoD/SigA n=1 Tax=Fimbriimonas ginsengisoli TaxID=1005039 RepID=A0A931PV11_FIMGI|nr:RNA polymerase sigma factor RpoD/SigA [Fimbriimonas ginsengisoli]
MSAHPHMPEYDDSLPSYLSRLTQTPLLSAEGELELTRAVQLGDACAKKRLIEANMRLVINIAKTYRNRSIPLEDLIQEGAIGLMQAADRFDPGRGFRFSTYATHWIRQAIGRAIDNKSKAIRLPAHIAQSLRRLERERVRMARELGYDPTPEQLAYAIGCSPKKLLALVQSSQELLSLDMTVGETGTMTLGGLVKDTRNGDPEALMLSLEVLQEIDRIIMELNEREQRVMRMRFRFDGLEPPLHEDVAREMKLSRERVRQIEIQAIKKLRALAQRRRLREMLGR